VPDVVSGSGDPGHPNVAAGEIVRAGLGEQLGHPALVVVVNDGDRPAGR
jgi:hypothetical protein